MAFEKGDRVKWNWGNGTAEGTVQAKYTEKVEKEIKGSTVTRDASEDEPAYLVVQDDDDKVLKSGSELEAA